MTTKTPDQLYDILYDAQALLFNAIELLETYVRETDDREAEAYVIDHLKIIAGRDHGFLASDLNIDDLMERLDDRDDEAANDNQPPADVRALIEWQQGDDGQQDDLFGDDDPDARAAALATAQGQLD